MPGMMDDIALITLEKKTHQTFMDRKLTYLQEKIVKRSQTQVSTPKQEGNAQMSHKKLIIDMMKSVGEIASKMWPVA